ncbi:HTH domain-containing protein [Megamonas hypermegale]|uniref:HTH domain-containing protein n=1 Tax=Megamonas hypermegale TaxID=158847 RepID=UPI0026EB7428|nr:HTH domain-containing protein [Megamonas hypermegale]
MAGKVFTDEEKELLSKNPYVESVEPTRIIYTDEFKIYYVKNYLEGKKPTEIFISAGFDPGVLGNKRIERASARWRKLYADGQLNINGEEKMEQTDMENKSENKPEKKRRGRPRKNPAVAEEAKTEENMVAEEKAEYTAPKKRRGRPRKNPPAETAETTEETTVKKPRKRVNKIAAMAQSIKTAEQKAAEAENTADNQPKEEKQPQQAKPAKRRGRPRKNTAEAPAKAENTAPKKRRGRPRKNAQPVASTVTEEVKSAPVQVEKPAEPIVPVMPKEQEAEINERPITALVKAINRLTRQVDSLKRLVAGKKKVNY